MQKLTIGFIGLGLMGGSLSIALRKTHQDYHFIGLDHNTLHCQKALALELVDEIAEDLQQLSRCDILFLSIPVDGIIAIIKQLTALSSSTTVIDLGSTKEKYHTPSLHPYALILLPHTP